MNLYIISISVIIFIISLILISYFEFWKKTNSCDIKYPYFPSTINYDKIPRVVYQTWHTYELPPKMKETNEELKKNNPEFEYKLFDDNKCREFIKSYFDVSVLNAYDSLVPGAFKADLWRYCILFINGGIYLDIKYNTNNHEQQYQTEGNKINFRLIDLFNIEKYPIPMVIETSPLYVYTGLLVTPPKNPLYLACIHRIVENVKNKYYGNSPMSPTGPELFGQLILEKDKKRAVLFYYDDYFLKEGEENKRIKYKKRGFIKDIRNNINILSHYLDYRIEQQKYANTKYWMNSWKNKEIYNIL